MLARIRVFWIALFCLLCSATSRGAEAKPAELKISGYGFVRDWQLKQMLRTIEGKQLKQPYLSANLIEDCAVILLSRLKKDGFLHPAIELRLTLLNGEKSTIIWKDAIEPPLPGALQVRKVHFKLQPGTRYHYREIEFEGLVTIRREKALSFFVETGVIPFHSSRVYSPDNLRRGLSSLTEVLQRQGYSDATATVRRQESNDRNGAVDVWITVKQGPRYVVRSIRVETYVGGAEVGVRAPGETQMIQTNVPYSRYWAEDLSTGLKATNFHRGYPDTTVLLQTLGSNTAPGLVFLQLLATVKTGPEVFVKQIKFQGAKRTRDYVMKRRLSLKPGDRLDPLKAERGRNRLARLGIFDSVQLRYVPVEAQSRDVIYDLKEAKGLTINLLAGWGSYEMLRGGVEVQKNNIFGRAHSARMRAIQSFKSSEGDFTYTIPDLLGEDIDAFSHGFALRREEISFTREEYGGGAGVHRHFRSISTDLTGRYEYQVLNAVSLGGDFQLVGPLNPGVGAVIADFQHDRRDNPLYPRRGYKIFSILELASTYLAGDVTYQRFSLAASYHQPIIAGLGLNLGLSHGFITTPGTSEQEVPFNKRYFPGGADSIRGYQEGEAAPLNAQGKLIGAESYLLGSVELEQSLTRLFSIVVFSDSVGITPRFSQYPFDETLYSVGGGLRLKTIVGPVRLEYGQNINPRPQDPSGTFHFSFGFPF